VPESDLQVAFGDVMRTLRLAAGLSQEELSFLCGRHRTFVSVIERGKNAPSLTTIWLLAGALEVAASEVLRPSRTKAGVDTIWGWIGLRGLERHMSTQNCRDRMPTMETTQREDTLSSWIIRLGVPSRDRQDCQRGDRSIGQIARECDLMDSRRGSGRAGRDRRRADPSAIAPTSATSRSGSIERIARRASTTRRSSERRPSWARETG
jgi:transcriptional regulator with XRE-family HTH domain